MRYLQLNAEGVVTNIVLWDGVSPYTPEGMAQLLPCEDNDGISFGWKIVDGTWEAPQPYPSWTLDVNHDWQPPIPKPEGQYSWNEEELEWVAF